MLEGILVEGLIYGIMVLGVFITFRVMDFPDLTVDGSFPMGAAIMTICLVSGLDFWFALLLSFLGGMAAGTITALIHNKLKIPNLLAGILTMTMLYSINIRILGGRSNIPLMKQDTILTRVADLLSPFMSKEFALLLFFILLLVLVKTALDLFFKTDLGLSLRALGNNEQMVISQGVNPESLKIIGLALSNGLVAFSGAFAAQYQGFADVGLGQGIIISGLASVMLGEFLFRSRKIWVLTLCAVLGSILFKGIMYLGRYYGYAINMTPNDLKLITGLLIILSIVISRFQNKHSQGRKSI